MRAHDRELTWVADPTDGSAHFGCGLELHLRNARPDIPDGTIVECGYNDLGFFVEKIRTDKTHANNRRTFSRTMVNIREAINYDELLCV